MKILVIGGAGYIGSHAVAQLIDDKHEVVVFDNLATGNAKAVHPQATFIEGDQLNQTALEKVFQKHQFDVVMHLAGKLIVPESVKEPIEYFENNVHGVALLLAAMRKYKVKNIVFSSTAAVYGNPQRVPAQEDDVKLPINPYGASKLACEWLIEGASKAHGFNYVIFRYFNVAGADPNGNIGQATKNRTLTHLVPVVIETVLQIRLHMNIFGLDYDTRDGSCVRDYIHVVDLARAHLIGAKYAMSGKSGTYNLGSQTGFSVKEIIDTTEKVLKKPVNFQKAPRRAGDPATLVADVSKVKQELQFELNYSLADMISSDYQWREILKQNKTPFWTKLK